VFLFARPGRPVEVVYCHVERRWHQEYRQWRHHLLDVGVLRQRKCSVMGWSAWRCNDTFWLSDTVSKHLTFPAMDTIQGNTFSPPMQDSTSSFDALHAAR
jgi:hypothetical protein